MSYPDPSEGILQQRKLSLARNLFGAQRSNYDRFIPCRANNNWETSFATIPEPQKSSQTSKKARDSGENARDSSVYNCLLRNELLMDNIEDVKSQCDERQALTPVKNKNLFRYGTAVKVSRVVGVSWKNVFVLLEYLRFCVK